MDTTGLRTNLNHTIDIYLQPHKVKPLKPKPNKLNSVFKSIKNPFKYRFQTWTN